MGVRPNVVVIGAGFGGLAAARGLAKSRVEVTLIDRHNFTTFQPLLYQVATAGLNAADVGYPIRGLFHRQRNFQFRQGEVVGVNWDSRELTLLPDQPGVPFDHLVVATGAVTSWFGVPGAEKWAMPLYTLEDAIRLRNHILECFEEADRDPTLIDDGALTFVVVGGGPTGVEMAGALAELVAVVFRRDFPHLPIERAHIVLVEVRSTLLEPFKPGSQKHAEEMLLARQVDVRLEDSVAEVERDRVRFGSGDILPAHTVIWAAGVRAHPLVKTLGLATNPQGRIVVGPDLAVPERSGVWAIGDVAAAPDRKGNPLPQLAPVAIQSGTHVARQITRQMERKPTKRFRFVNKGTMATIGRRAAVAELPGGLRLRGTLAWMAWLGLHIMYLAGFRNRASVMLNWLWGYVTWDRGPRLILRPRPDRQADDASD